MEAYVNNKMEELNENDQKILEDIKKDQTLLDDFVLQCYDGQKSMYFCVTAFNYI